MPDGTLDFDDEQLRGFDIVLASLHDAGGQDGAQLIKGNWMATPYCQDKQLFEVANSRGFKTSFEAIRNNPNHKKELCRFLFSDIRVEMTCLDAGVPEYYTR